MTPDDVQMQVENDLVGIRAGIDDQAITAFGNAFLVSNRFDNGQHMAQELFVLFRDFIG